MFPGLWIVLTLIAAMAQTVRNTTQRELTKVIGTIGATNVRFLYGLPFAIVFFIIMTLVTGTKVAAPSPPFWLYVTAGALTQIVATGLMLAAMRDRAFLVVVAYTKTEPVFVALFAAVALGDPLSPVSAVAVVIATLGVMIMSWPDKVEGSAWSARAVLLGLSSGAMFAVAAVGFRGAILALHLPFVPAATTTLVIGLAIQAGVISAYLGVFDRPVLVNIARAWRASLPAGFAGAFASQLWFLAFAIESVAKVRTLALVEVLFAWIAGRKLMKETLTRRELLGVALLTIGVALIVNG